MTIEDKTIDFGSIFSRRGNNNQNDDKKNEPRMIDVVAWYSPQIPVSAGPDRYWGLPGLILELQEKNVIFGAKKINLNQISLPIVKPDFKKAISETEYNKILQKFAPQE